MTVPVGVSVFSGLSAATTPYLDQVAEPFDSLWFPDHLQSNAVGVMEGWTLLAYHLARFPDKTCGHQVLCNEFRHPAVLAKMVASAQVLSEGRVVLGIGAGWHRDEADAYGLEFGSTPQRVARMSEAIELIRLLWSGESVTYQGDHYRVKNAECIPAPAQEPPVMVGGSGERLVLGAVAAHADLWNYIYRNVEEFEHKLGVLRGHCRRIGRDPDEITPVLGSHILVAETESELRRLQESPEVRTVHTNGIAGTPEQVAEDLLKGISAGAGQVIVGFADAPRTDGTELFARDVLPVLQWA